MCLGLVDQEIFEKGILAVFEGLLGFCHHNFVLDITQSYRADNFLLKKLWFKVLA
jgi:hypothetical protein